MSDPTSTNMSFVGASLVRDGIASHRMQLQADLGAQPTETAWYCLFPYKVLSGLRLSHSSTLRSAACVLSAVLGWFACKHEAACLMFAAGSMRAAQPRCASSRSEIQEVTTETGCSLSADTILSGDPHSAVRSSEQKGAKVPGAPLHVPTLQLQVLQRYSLMCGENQRVPISEALGYVLRGMLLRCRQQLPLAVWQRICLKSMHALQESAAKVGSASLSYGVSQHEKEAEKLDECPWGQVQEVLGEMMKLMLLTVHEVHSQSMQEQFQQSGGWPGGSSEALVSHEDIVERLYAVNCSIVMTASLLLSDAPAMYRNLEGTKFEICDVAMVRSCTSTPCSVQHAHTNKPSCNHRMNVSAVWAQIHLNGMRVNLMNDLKSPQHSRRSFLRN